MLPLVWSVTFNKYCATGGGRSTTLPRPPERTAMVATIMPLRRHPMVVLMVVMLMLHCCIRLDWLYNYFPLSFFVSRLLSQNAVAQSGGRMVSLHGLVFTIAPPSPSSSSALLSSDGDQERSKISAAMKRIMQSAQIMRGFAESIVATNRVQMLCSLLSARGDLNALPRWSEAPGHMKCACGNSTVAQVFGATAVHASARVERDIQQVLRHWWRTEYNVAETTGEDCDGGDHYATASPSNGGGHVDVALLHQARLAVQLLPTELLRESYVATECCGTIWRAFGFFARVGLHDPRTLSAWFSTWDANAVGVHVPDVLERSALFPFIRLVEHSCRPNCALSFLDSPVTHTSGAVNVFNYDTKADDSDPYEGKDEAARKQISRKQLEQLWWPCETTQRVFSPSVVLLTATRDIAEGESISIAYIPATYMPFPDRRRALLERYQFQCSCRWCTVEPDLARGFRCPRCPPNQGVICPYADGRKWDLWECVQCGYHPDKETEIPKMLDAEASLSRIKADKAKGLVALLDDPFVHYSHAIVFKKLDAWSEAAWKEQDANLCIGLIESLQRCARRVLREDSAAQGALQIKASSVLTPTGGSGICGSVCSVDIIQTRRQKFRKCLTLRRRCRA
ncbi:Hypothetical protein, putative [Bodo saltans]|uniref:SET domain-containing protein n=1 Tax=Bodo saltans TaxID=75058 RepID=A0A0S4IZB1_BODSA|nr:Hypothetical protein, putative [Bodo saltans]|eukprot:CUG07226.1 Hypothetical protein, putative [Bodo saltans]